MEFIKGETDKNRTLPIIKLPIKIAKEKLIKYDWDNFIIISGDVGTGKSNLALSFLEAWNRELNGGVSNEDINFMCMDIKEFVTRLNGISRYKMIILDESGELSNLRQMDLFNYNLTKTYQVIRGLNLFTILIIPSVFRLNPYFVWDRARALIHVYKRNDRAGYSTAGYYTRRQLRFIMSANERKNYKKISIGKSLFINRFFKYESVYTQLYAQKKEERIKRITEELDIEINASKDNKTTKYQEALYKFFKSGISESDIAKIMGVDTNSIIVSMNKYKRKFERGK